jgi:hypothetical protein
LYSSPDSAPAEAGPLSPGVLIGAGYLALVLCA